MSTVPIACLIPRPEIHVVKTPLSDYRHSPGLVTFFDNLDNLFGGRDTSISYVTLSL